MERLHQEKAAVRADTTQGTLPSRSNRLRTLQESGATFSQVFTVTVLFFVGILEIKFIAPWSDYLRLKAAMKASVHQAQISTDAALMNAVLDKATQLKIPLVPGDVHLTRNGQGDVRLWAEYAVTLAFPLGFSHTQTFRPQVRSMRR
jgi:hypothetical protein